MSEFFFAIFATIYIFLLFMIIIFCIYFDYVLAANQAMELENILRNCANQVDPDQENFEIDNVDIPPPYLNFWFIGVIPLYPLASFYLIKTFLSNTT